MNFLQIYKLCRKYPAPDRIHYIAENKKYRFNDIENVKESETNNDFSD